MLKRKLPAVNYGGGISVVNAEALLGEIERDMPYRSPQILEAGHTPAPELPDYVEHAADISRVGRLTSEALAIEYESAAKSIEEMGKHLLDLQKRMDAEAAEILKAIEEVQAVAKHYREEGKRMFERIEDCARQTQRIRDICLDLRPKPTE